jgi:hypothetical protein
MNEGPSGMEIGNKSDHGEQQSAAYFFGAGRTSDEEARSRAAGAEALNTGMVGIGGGCISLTPKMLAEICAANKRARKR